MIGSLAVMLAAWNKAFHIPAWKAAFGATATLISACIVFLKQHSVLDILAAPPTCLLTYPLSYGWGAMRSITLRKDSN